MSVMMRDEHRKVKARRVLEELWSLSEVEDGVDVIFKLSACRERSWWMILIDKKMNTCRMWDTDSSFTDDCYLWQRVIYKESESDRFFFPNLSPRIHDLQFNSGPSTKHKHMEIKWVISVSDGNVKLRHSQWKWNISQLLTFTVTESFFLARGIATIFILHDVSLLQNDSCHMKVEFIRYSTSD